MNAAVYVIDDDEELRVALVRLLDGAGLHVEAFASAEAFLVGWRGDQHGCLVLDVRLPGLSGPELQAALAARGIEMPIIFLTGRGDVATSVKAMKAGAFDFLEKPVSPQLLLERVQGALAQERRQHAARAEAAAAAARLERLTAREREILTEVVAGRSSKEIARRLGISSRTVELHRAHIMEKTEARNPVELARLAALDAPGAGERRLPRAKPTAPPSRRAGRG